MTGIILWLSPKISKEKHASEHARVLDRLQSHTQGGQGHDDVQHAKVTMKPSERIMTRHTPVLEDM